MRKKVLYVILFMVICIFYNNIYAQTFKPFSKNLFKQTSLNLLEEVNIDSLANTVRELSGEKEVIINGKIDTILTRNKYTNQVGKVSAYLKKRFENYSLTTTEQTFNYKFNSNLNLPVINVFATQTGTKYPNKKFIICAHYDDMPGLNTAPGADDNASGIAAVIEAARIISKYYPQYTIIYALWDAEEQGMIGSDYYAKQARASNDSILGVLNIDMIGWDSNKDNVVEIHSSDSAASDQLAKTVNGFNTYYNIGLSPVIFKPGISGSDHYKFWLQKYSAILLIEKYSNPRDWNNNYHTVNDKIFYFNFSYFLKCSELMIQSLADLAIVNSQPTMEIHDNITPSSISLKQNYPNPFNPVTTIEFDLASYSFVTLKIFNTLGIEVKSLIDEYLTAGRYQTKWASENLPSGIYYYRLQSGNETKSQKAVLLK